MPLSEHTLRPRVLVVDALAGQAASAWAAALFCWPGLSYVRLRFRLVLLEGVILGRLDLDAVGGLESGVPSIRERCGSTVCVVAVVAAVFITISLLCLHGFYAIEWIRKRCAIDICAAVAVAIAAAVDVDLAATARDHGPRSRCAINAVDKKREQVQRYRRSTLRSALAVQSSVSMHRSSAAVSVLTSSEVRASKTTSVVD